MFSTPYLGSTQEILCKPMSIVHRLRGNTAFGNVICFSLRTMREYEQSIILKKTLYLKAQEIYQGTRIRFVALGSYGEEKSEK